MKLPLLIAGDISMEWKLAPNVFKNIAIYHRQSECHPDANCCYSVLDP